MLERNSPEAISFVDTANWLKGVYFLRARVGGEDINQEFVIE
ncbi:MAG: hypothetical protein H6558_14475 [Lewinellaceae bacterium]|nr:hypothetical protein [Lewinellaceae bacterium]MCB9286007.1 hypothetical protein [Lewinellaceae bacterium]